MRNSQTTIDTTFKWLVRDNGYQWDSTIYSESSVLVPAMPWSEYEYHPLKDETALFRNFADLSGSPEGIVTFANRYGMLFSGDRAETLADWKAHIQHMKHAIELWRIARETDYSEEKCFAVTEAIEKGCRDRAEDKFRFDPRYRNGGWVRRPLHLLGAMWLQLSHGVTSSIGFRRCAEKSCRRWFVIMNLTRNHCSDKCKQRTHYRLKKEAEAKKIKEEKQNCSENPQIQPAP